MDSLHLKIGGYWSNKVLSSPRRLRWWQSAAIIKHVNRIICGRPVDGFSSGLHELVCERARSRLPFQKAISVGGGSGLKEMALLEKGIVGHFDVYEYSEARIDKGRELATKKSLSDRIHFFEGNAFDILKDREIYDMVHWNNSLHHMLDVDAAVNWSRHVLKTGGLFYMDDFVGASRFQWTDEELEFATNVRKIFLGTKYLINPKNPSSNYPVKIQRPSIRSMLDSDPSEAADSENISSAILKYFPNVEYKATGGVIFHLALNDIIENFDESEDALLLESLLMIDKLVASLGHTHYAVALAFKNP